MFRVLRQLFVLSEAKPVEFDRFSVRPASFFRQLPRFLRQLPPGRSNWPV